MKAVGEIPGMPVACGGQHTFLIADGAAATRFPLGACTGDST